MAKTFSSPPEMEIDPAKRYVAEMETSMGSMTIELDPVAAPKTVNNFVFLARQGYYDGVMFHRVIQGFVLQGGDPEGTGRGGPGYKFEDEPVKGDYGRGAVAMANAGPNTNGSQFFICHQDLAGKLPKNYTLFGQVTKGMDVVDKIVNAPRNSRDLPDSPVAMTSVTIEED